MSVMEDSIESIEGIVDERDALAEAPEMLFSNVERRRVEVNGEELSVRCRPRKNRR